MKLWSKLELDSGVFIMKFDVKKAENGDDVFNFWLSDFKELWTESFATKEALLNRISNANPDLIVDGIEEILIDALGTTDKKTTQIIKNVKLEDGDFQLELKYFMDGGPSMKLPWHLKKCDSQTFFDQFTKHLLHHIGEYEHIVKQLTDMIKKKDDEIQQHKIEGAKELQRTRFITEKFDETMLASSSKLFTCEMDEFESVVDTLSKNIARVEPITVIKTPPKPNLRNNRNQRRPMPFQPIVRQGVNYVDSDDDDEEETNANPNQSVSTASGGPRSNEKINTNPPTEVEPVKVSSKKRIRRNLNL